HRRLDVLDRGVGDEGGIVRLLPDPVIERGHLGRADLVADVWLCRIWRLLGEGRRYDEPRIEPECSRQAGRNDEVAPRQIEHGDLLQKFSRARAAAPGMRVPTPKTRGSGGLFPAKGGLRGRQMACVSRPSALLCARAGTQGLLAPICATRFLR